MLHQTIVFAVLSAAAVLFVWGPWRYDVVAVIALLTLAITGVVPAEEVFVGFGHPAVITVAAVLVISRGLENAGVIDIFARAVLAAGKRPLVQLAVLTGLAAALSAFINNIGALALLMPVAVQMARRSGLPPSRVLMPLAFASLLGGMVTLIGTPSNIIISTLRRETVGSGFAMFDFAPVGAAVAALGLIVVAVAVRLVPRRDTQLSREGLFELEAYTTEVSVPQDSPAVGRPLLDVMGAATDAVVAVIVRGEHRIFAPLGSEVIEAGDALIVEADAASLHKLIRNAGLAMAGQGRGAGVEALASDEVRLLEVVVRPGSSLEGRTARSVHLRRYYQVNLLAVARGGQRIGERLSRIHFHAGDVLLLQGELAALQRAMRLLGLLPLAERDLRLPRPRRILLSVGIFAGAVAAGGVGLVPIETAFAAAALLLILSRVLALQQAYEALDLPVLVLLGAMLPVGHALETSGGARLAGEWLAGAGHALPEWGAVFILLVATSLLSNLVNNAAVAVVMAPVAIAIAAGLGANADPFLMAVAIGAGAAFLTPIGHQCNALVMGPGGYRFGDYWRLGLPLTLVVAVAAVPLILWVWPLR